MVEAWLKEDGVRKGRDPCTSGEVHMLRRCKTVTTRMENPNIGKYGARARLMPFELSTS